MSNWHISVGESTCPVGIAALPNHAVGRTPCVTVRGVWERGTPMSSRPIHPRNHRARALWFSSLRSSSHSVRLLHRLKRSLFVSPGLRLTQTAMRHITCFSRFVSRAVCRSRDHPNALYWSSPHYWTLELSSGRPANVVKPTDNLHKVIQASAR